jgi:hypothetical protein
VAVDCEVVGPPAVRQLYFWALQVTFEDGAGAHTGLQWNPRHPGNRAVNWGGYAARGGLLAGTESALPSTPHDPNTRDLWWEPGRPHRLRVWAPEPGRWRASVDDVVVRDLFAPGTTVRAPMVWSEVFAPCDDPSVMVRWSAFEAVDRRGRRVAPDRMLVNYQRDGCTNTCSLLDGRSVLQVTNTDRTTPQGAVLDLR